jgi:hypothetical protein
VQGPEIREGTTGAGAQPLKKNKKIANSLLFVMYTGHAMAQG